jgi:hypothetical protein
LEISKKVEHHTVLLLVNWSRSPFKYPAMKNSKYKKYSDLSLDELEKLVEELEIMSIKALKERKKTLRASILRSVRKAIKEIEKRLKK